MNVTLLHNSGAGHETYSREKLMGLLRDAGYDPAYQSLEDQDIEEALREAAELVAVAGGDGTVRSVAHHLVGEPVTLAVLPLGTANNLGRACGWTGPVDEIVAAWPNAHPHDFDVGVAHGPWGEQFFFEAAGLGLFPEGMPRLSRSKEDVTFDNRDDELRHDVAAFRTLLHEFPARRWRIALDGEQVSGRYLMVEAMNSGWFGPCLHLAPEAEMGDGYFDVVFLPEDEREEFARYLNEHAYPGVAPPELEMRRAERVELQWDRGGLHVDDAVWPEKEEAVLPNAEEPPKEDGAVETVTFTLRPGALSVLARGA